LNRRQIATGIAILVALTIMGVWGYTAFSNARSGLAQQDKPVAELNYCDVDASRLCVVSFGIDLNGRMLVNFMAPNESFPDFYLKIQRAEGESIYECQKVEGFPASIYCIGERIPFGEIFEVQVFTQDGDELIARGSLAISSLAHPTLSSTYITPTFGARTSTPPSPGATATPVPTATGSYPNPPYSNPP